MNVSGSQLVLAKQYRRYNQVSKHQIWYNGQLNQDVNTVTKLKRAQRYKSSILLTINSISSISNINGHILKHVYSGHLIWDRKHILPTLCKIQTCLQTICALHK
jgi:hypothetical protein